MSAPDVAELLADRRVWARADPAAQDAAIESVAARLEPGYELVGAHPCGPTPRLRVGVFRHRRTGLLLHLVPGDPAFAPGRAGGDPREAPRAPVPIAPLLVGQAPVLWGEWTALSGAAAPPTDREDVPVSGVSWHAARAWLGQAGGGLRLPREAEWEHACRAGATTVFPWGDAFDPARCWFLDNADGRAHPTREHAEQVNGLGLVDTCGNVSEWCEDDLVLPMEGSAWQEQDPGKVHRGGSFDQPSIFCRASYRAGSDPRATYPDLGFRAFADVEV